MQGNGARLRSIPTPYRHACLKVTALSERMHIIHLPPPFLPIPSPISPLNPYPPYAPHTLPVIRSNASRYFSPVFLTTSSGTSTPSTPFFPSAVSQSRRYCLS